MMEVWLFYSQSSLNLTSEEIGEALLATLVSNDNSFIVSSSGDSELSYDVHSSMVDFDESHDEKD